MNIMIASDIHGRAFYCRKLMKAFNQEHADMLLLLGDILGFDDEEVAEMLNRLNEETRIICVRGNCDTAMDQAMLDFPIMADSALLFFKGRIIYASHGHIQPPRLKPGDIFLQGHKHVPAWDYKDGRFYFNPGSVSEPRRGSMNSYMMLTDNGFLWKKLDGEVYHDLLLW